MRQTKKLTLSAMTVALGTLFMVLGGLIEVIDLSVCALASLLVVFVYIEIGSPYTWLVWLATSLCTFLLAPGKMIWIVYLFIFGVYPLLKGYIERLKKPLWTIIKLAYINAVYIALFYLSELIFGVPLIAFNNKIIVIAVYVLMNVAFVVYDMFLSVMVRVYLFKFRNRIKHLLK